MKIPPISIIMPVYNAEKYLCKSIDSILGQTFTEWELILVDDGSADNSPAICDEYSNKDKRIKVLHKKNEGVAIARKEGCEASTAERICFVDSDDTLDSNCLNKCMQILEVHNVDILVFGSIWCIEGTGKKSVHNPKYEGFYDKNRIVKDIYPELIQTEKAGYYPQSVWGSIYKRDSIVPYMISDRRAEVGEDGACVIPAIYHSESMFFVREPLYNYRVNADSVTGGRRVFNWDNPEAIAHHLETTIDIDKAGFRDQLNRRLCHDIFNVCVSRFYSRQGYRETAAEIKHNLKRDAYRRAIKEAHFKGSAKAALMMIALRTRCTRLMLIYSELNKK